MSWGSINTIKSKKFKCGYCGNMVASNIGYPSSGPERIHICPHCDLPTFFDFDGSQIPGISPGGEVGELPDDLEALYREARNCVSINSHTSAVLTCRKLLMNIAVSLGAESGKSFISYVQYLADNGYVPPNGKGWVDHIRNKGNEANHEIILMGPDDAKELILFIEMLLKFIYEFPAKVPDSTST